MKLIKKYPLISVIAFTLLLWGILLITGVIINDGAKKVSVLASRAEFGVNILTILLLTYILVKFIDKNNRKLLLWLYTINWILFAVDFLFYIAAYANQTYLQNMPFVSFLFYYFPCIFYCFVMIAFLSKVLLKHVLSNKSFVKIILALIIFNILVLGLYLPNIHYVYKVMSWDTISQIAMLCVELIMFDFAVLGIIFSNTTTATLFLSGTIILITSDFLLTYSYTSQTIALFSYGELFWLLGLMFLLYSILNMFINKDYDLKVWFQDVVTIRTRIVFWTFSISVFGFLFFFILAYSFSLVDKGVFVSLPLFILIYSIIFLLLSSYVGKAFEVPFLKLQKIISELRGNSVVSNVDFNIKEFDYLKGSIINAFKYRDERDNIKNEFGVLVAEVAHDLKSPLMELDFVIDKIRKNNSNKDLGSDINDVDRLIKEIKSISASILTNYYQLTDDSNQVYNNKALGDDGNLPRFLNFPNLLEGLIESKKLEWSDSTYNVRLVVDDNLRCKFIYIAPTKILRALSNLLNNSHQSLLGRGGDITIYLKYVDDKYFNLIIEDSGCGISKEKIYNVLNGHSSKHSGKGIGIPSTLSYLKTINGNLSIESELNKGTKIIISMPLTPCPKWFDNTIHFNKNTIFVVLDDDQSMILLWQKIFSKIGVKGFYFLDIIQLQAWYKDNKENEIIILSDYDLKNKLTGLDIINNMSVMQAYLVTHHAEEQWLQEKIEQTDIKLTPKYMVHDIKIIRF